MSHRKPKNEESKRLVLLGGGPKRPTGAVWLVGAGPGDPELLTIKALKALQAAEVVVHDGLVSDEILALAPSSARRISVAKRKSRHSYAQDEINRMLVAFAQDGLNVVRLKGGDPFIFGRGGEELEACREAGVECHVVPGVTAALAAGANAGAPLTHRGSAQAVTFVTGHAAAGAVWLVGAGPGDPELLTIKALKVLQAAEVVVHDGLVSDEILALAPSAARRISVAKRKSRHSYAQDEINRMLVAFAQDGLNVVRLKGGDPFIFGRGGEELEACREAGVECHVVPGVTAALAASANAGAPLTHRGAAQAVTFVTGHAAAGSEPDLDWQSLAKVNQTVVIYMGVSTAAGISARLMEAGRAGSTPALIVENASRADERRLVTTLAGLSEAAADVAGPALLIVGEAMALARASDIEIVSQVEARGRELGVNL